MPGEHRAANKAREIEGGFVDSDPTSELAADFSETARILFAAGSVTVSQAREQLTGAVQTILGAGITAGTLRDDVRAEDIVATVVGMFTATSLAGGHEQLERMLDLLMDAVRRPSQ